MAKEAKKHRVFIFYVTAEGRGVAQRIKEAVFPEAELSRYKKGVSLKEIWREARLLVFVAASGIAVRAIAPHVGDKREDPAVISVDGKGENVISLLSGHTGGANRFARMIASGLGARAVVSTETDINSLTPVDVFAMENGFFIESPELLPALSARHLEQKKLMVYSEIGIKQKLPRDYERAKTLRGADVLITHKIYKGSKPCLRPRSLVAGIGLNSGTSASEIEGALEDVFKSRGLSLNSLGMIATHRKKLREPGLREAALKYGVKIKGFDSGELNSVRGVRKKSPAALKALGAQAVAEPAARLASGGGRLVAGKTIRGKNLTLAVSLKGEGKNILRVVGTGPGGLSHMTPLALEAIREADFVVGYGSYLRHIEPILKGKKVISSGMTEEIARAQAAIRLAREGKKVCLISGGDPGVYGMAGLAIGLLKGNTDVGVEVIPGVSALNACAARLGAPLMHDFAVISLSDRLTPWPVIERRLAKAAEGDFVIVLFNPKSRGRHWQLEKAREIILGHRAAETLVGIVRDATRDDEDALITTLKDMPVDEVDMKCTVIVGSSKSLRAGGYMLTPRGYEDKYEI